MPQGVVGINAVICFWHQEGIRVDVAGVPLVHGILAHRVFRLRSKLNVQKAGRLMVLAARRRDSVALSLQVKVVFDRKDNGVVQSEKFFFLLRRLFRRLSLRLSLRLLKNLLWSLLFRGRRFFLGGAKGACKNCKAKGRGLFKLNHRSFAVSSVNSTNFLSLKTLSVMRRFFKAPFSENS